MVKPPRLRPGDTIGLVSPAGPMHAPDELTRAREQVALLGLRSVIGAHAADQYGYLAGTDEARAEDFNRFARDPQIRGIFALRGGYGTMRILDRIDYAALKSNPKVVLGFSDLTALLNAITWRTGLVTFHGPVAALSTFTPAVVEGIRRATMSSKPIGTLHVADTVTLHAGTARGQLAGGNLSLVSSLCGTPYAIPMTGKILLLEEVDEPPYQIDRMLTQLRMTGELARVAGIAVGKCRGCELKPENLPSLSLEQTLRDRLGDLGKPAAWNMQFGHVRDQWTIPLGLEATLAADTGELTIEEAAVREG